MGLDANIYIAKKDVAIPGEESFAFEVAYFRKTWWLQELLEEIKGEKCPYGGFWELDAKVIDVLCARAVDVAWDAGYCYQGDVEDMDITELFKAIGQAKLAFKNGYHVYYKADW